MKVILTKQVPKLGGPGDIVDVSVGYARNFLIPKGLSKEATGCAIEQLKVSKFKKSIIMEMKIGFSKKLGNVLEGQKIIVLAKANEEGHLFGGIGQKEIASAIEKQKNIRVNEEWIQIERHLKNLGRHNVKIKTGKSGFASIILDIQRDSK